MGLYRLSGATGDRWFAVGPGSPPAGLIRPGETPGEQNPLRLAPTAHDSGLQSSVGRLPQAVLSRIPLWPWLLCAAIAAVVGEWALATHRGGGGA
jgi:hypothetical protein